MNQSIKYTIKETITLLGEFFDISNNDTNRYKYDEIISKLKKETIDIIIENFQLVVGVNKNYSNTDELQAKHVRAVKQKQLALLFMKCLDKNYTDKTKKIDIQIINYNKQYFEIEEYLAGITFLVNHTPAPSSKSIEIASVDNIITIDPKKIAKNVKKSITSTLTGKKDDNYFRVHPNTKNEIVSFEHLGEYAHLKYKHRNIKCPICNKNIKITSQNIKEKILISNEKITKIVCHHSGTNNASDLLYKIEISQDKKMVGKTHQEKAMYILNNYEKLVEINKHKN